MKDFDDFARTGAGAGSVKIAGGRIKGVDLLATAAGLAGLGAVATGASSGEMPERVRGGAGKFLVGEDGRVEIPLVMTGPLASPGVAIDPVPLAAGAGRKVLRGLTDRIPGIGAAPGTNNATPAKKPQKEEPLREVEELFRKILPGK